MADAAYNSAQYRKAKQRLRGLPCHLCGAPSDTVDHVPPVRTFNDPRLWSGRLLPACAKCNFSSGAKFGRTRRAPVVGTPSRLW